MSSLVVEERSTASLCPTAPSTAAAAGGEVELQGRTETSTDFTIKHLRGDSMTRQKDRQEIRQKIKVGLSDVTQKLNLNTYIFLLLTVKDFIFF